VRKRLLSLSRFGLVLLIVLSLFVNAYSVSVVKQENNTPPKAENSVLRTIIIWVFVMSFISVLVIGVVLIFAWILVKIYKKLTEYNRRKKDFVYSVMFLNDLNRCHINRDKKLKKRNWKLMWVFFKRELVYYDDGNGYKPLGFYNGESINKENYYLISLYNKIGMFKFIEQIVIIPNTIKGRLIKEPVVKGQRVIVLDCEGVDNTLNTDYYMIPLVKDDKTNKYIDFSDEIFKNYIEKTVYRDIIKENLLDYKKGISNAVESNPKVQMKRRSE